MTTWEEFEARLYPEPNTGCMLWGGAWSVRGGYGVAYFGGRSTPAHRVALVLAGREIPEGAHVLHKCDTPACCNPDHLVIGDHALNMADGAMKRRSGRRRELPFGVSKYRDKFGARLSEGGRKGRWLGVFDTPEAAAAVVAEARKVRDESIASRLLAATHNERYLAQDNGPDVYAYWKAVK